MLYERTALSKKPDSLIRKELSTLRGSDRLTPDLVFQDPYLLDFLGLRDTFREKDLESALLREIERFLLEMGTGFAFVERQKRIAVVSGTSDEAIRRSAAAPGHVSGSTRRGVGPVRLAGSAPCSTLTGWRPGWSRSPASWA